MKPLLGSELSKNHEIMNIKRVLKNKKYKCSTINLVYARGNARRLKL